VASQPIAGFTGDWLVIDAFGGTYAGRTVLVTGHTGFKGSWLALWLTQLGARVLGVALEPPSTPNYFTACRMAGELIDLRQDIRDYEALAAEIDRHRPQIVFHLAAQPIVRRAFDDPRTTFEINVMGTVNVLEAARRCPSVEAVLIATSDKSYRNVGWEWAYRETDPLGGHEPYAGSKACAEIVTEVYRHRQFQSHAQPPSALAVASARAGNVIGGGDWAADRLVPDVIRAIGASRNVTIRNPSATRPWQHVLDCLAGYLQLASQLVTAPGRCEQAWNFGPSGEDPLPVVALVARILESWPDHATRIVIEADPPGKESAELRVDSSKAIRHLGWRPCWSTLTALDATVAWYHAFAQKPGRDMRALTLRQIEDYTDEARKKGIGWAVR
jgi:CDP-glucose 4,6-dehydratase